VIGLLSRRLLFVTGKGGVGKTTVAAALGQLASELGLRALVCEVEPKGDIAAAYECGPLGFVPREVAPGLDAMEMDTEASLREYLRLNLRVPTVGRIGPVARAFDFVASAAPGVREILTVGKLCYEVRENHYDVIVVDASATGNIVGQLAAPVGINDLVKVGAVRTQTRWMLDILEDPVQTGVCVVTTPEEMPVIEAVELAHRLESETGVHLAALVANRVMPELFSRGEEEVFDALVAGDGAANIASALGDVSEQAVAEVLEAAALAVRIRRSGAGHLERLRAEFGSSLPIAYVPYLFGRAYGARAVRRVAKALDEELGE
jgi:anion-transporting  ArsA/GET3 family ATPase